MFNHPGIFLLPVCLLEFFPLYFIHVVSENEAIYKVFGLVHFSWNEFWRVAIPLQMCRAMNGDVVVICKYPRHFSYFFIYN